MRFSTSAAAVPEPYHGRQRSRTLSEWLLIAMVTFVVTLPVQQLRAFPTSLSDCQTPTGWNCSGFDDRDNDLFLCDTNTCKFDGECLQIGETVTCVCEFKCNNDYVPVCGSNKENYQNECLLRKDACKRQTEVLVVSEGACPVDAGSGSGDEANEGSGETSQKETSTCDICQFGAECDEDAEDVWFLRGMSPGTGRQRDLKHEVATWCRPCLNLSYSRPATFPSRWVAASPQATRTWSSEQ
ncbi:Tomoregulin-2 [Acipenser ruthenus]|uniref:Tomoregulin-2 n=1 Tax=Acipenser ruthenus TaxID=7906 RepID=A0A444UMY4_ACIRT|nr:Tomoregulin-2 [Acipenser ruthenus]